MNETPDELTPDEEQEGLPQPDEGDGDQPEPDTPDQTPAEAAAAEGSSEIPKKIERQVTAHRKALGKILGIDLAGAECPTCGGMGFTTGPQEEAPELLEDPTKEACPACNGLGQLISHSRAPGHELVVCVTCSGMGYRTKSQVVENVHALPVAAPTAAAAQMGQLLPDGSFLPFGATEPIRIATPAGT